MDTGEHKLKIFKIPISFSRAEIEKPKKKTKKKKQKIARKKYIRTLKKTYKQRKYFKQVFKRLYSCIDKLEISGDLQIGLGSPYRTGLMLGFYRSIWYIIPQLKDIKIEPDYFDYSLNGKARIKLNLYLFRLLPLIFYFLRTHKNIK